MALPTDESKIPTQELLEGQAQVWNHIFNFINSMSLKCAVELGIPDIINKHGKPITLSKLVDALPLTNQANSKYVYRLMRILVHSKLFVKIDNIADDEECYWLTPASRLLLRDEPLSIAPLALFALDPLVVDNFQHVAEWFQDGQCQTAFATTHGMTFWERTRQEPKLGHMFNEGMACDARLMTSMLVNNCKHAFEGLTSMVDVGGGTGSVARAIVHAFPSLMCTVLDLPHVVAGIQGTDNLTFMSGDMFEYIPIADAVFLKWILHDWNDEECVKILKKCREAIILSKDSGGKVIIVDMVVGNQKDFERTETQLCFDMLMMVLVNGSERTEEDWAKLFSAAGFTSYKITPILGLRSLIEVFP